MNRNLLSKIIALFSGIVLIYVAYNHNNNSIYEIKGSAYGTTWTIKSSEYIGDHHKDNIKKIISKLFGSSQNFQMNKVENKNWVLESQKTLKPLSFDGLYIHNDGHKKDKNKKQSIK